MTPLWRGFPGMRRLNVDPTRVGTGWALDFCAQALRNVIIGIEGDGRRNDGFMMRSHFDITVASEVMVHSVRGPRSARFARTYGPHGSSP